MGRYEIKYIQDLIDQGEHEQLDFKFEISDAKKIARTLVAFANTSGGRLLIGVKDNGRISGIRSEEEYYMVESAANLFCRPAVAFESRNWNVEGKTVLEIYVPPASTKPYYAKDEYDRWLAYLRVKDQNYLASIVQLKLWNYEKHDKGALIKFTRNESLLLEYLKNHRDAGISGIIMDTGLKKRMLIDMLVKLVAFDVVRMDFNDRGDVYSLNEAPGSDRS